MTKVCEVYLIQIVDRGDFGRTINSKVFADYYKAQDWGEAQAGYDRDFLYTIKSLAFDGELND